METRWVRVDPQNPDPAVMAQAAAALRDGALVAFPTETVYGLGANALRPDAVRRIFSVKGRPPDNPVIVHIGDLAALHQVALVRPAGPVTRLARAFWPGPLTLVLPRRPVISDLITAGLSTVAVRMPAHPVALDLIRRAGVPVAAPSANLSGRPSPSRGEHVADDLQGRVEWILDAGPTGVGVESTVLDPSRRPPVVLRPGGVTSEALEAVLQQPVVLAGPADEESDLPGSRPPPAPGMKYRHYAPRAPMVVFEGTPDAVAAAVRERLGRMAAGQRLGLLLAQETVSWLRQHDDVAGALAAGRVVLAELGPRDEPATAARRLFSALREMDDADVDEVIGELWPAHGLGIAVNNRLRKAAGGRVARCAPPP